MSPLEAFCGSPLVHRFGCGLLHFLWQGLLIAMILAVAMRVLRGRSAGARYLTAWTALLAMAVSVPISVWLTAPPLGMGLAGATAGPPGAESRADSAANDAGAISPYGIGEVPIATPATAPEVGLPATASSEASEDAEAATIASLAVRASQWVRPALPWVVCCWTVGTLALAIWRLGGWIGLRRLCRLGTSPASQPAGQMLQRLVTRLRIHRAVQLLESTLVEVPTVVGWLRPVILLPASILAELPAEQLELILAHELAHVRRHDFLLNLLQTAIETLLFYHPAVWWVSGRIRVEREACCDDLAVAGCGDRLLYARALTRLEELRHGPVGPLPANVGMAADGTPLLSRIRRVLGLPGDDQEGRRTWLGGSVAVLLLVGALVGYVATAGELRSRPAQADTRPAGAAGSSGAEKPRYAGEGLVVDDATGKPVEQIAVQEGVPNPGAESGIMWITMIQSEKGVPGGRFSITHNCVKEGKVRIRIVADGYLPEVAIVDTEDGLLKAPLVMRLRRGEAIRGRVIDHAGKPVAGAEVFLGGPDRHAEIVDGNAQGVGGKRETTDKDGRFVIYGAAPGEVHQIVLLPPGLHVWTVPVLQLGKELTVKLPEPATLVIRYDIPGDVPEGRFRVELKTWDMPDWNGAVSSVQNPTAKNQGEVVLKNMTPGIYDVIRMKLLRGGDSGTEAFCDRRDVTLEPGKTATLQFVRKKAFAIEGDLVGPEGTGIAEAFIYVRSPKATGDPRSLDDWKLPIYDGVTSAKDGKFKTAPIEPGEYLLVAEWFAPEPRGMGFGMGWPLPAYVGKAKVTVPKDGPPPRVRIEMKPRTAGQKAPPATAPAKASAEATGETPPTNRDRPVSLAQAIETFNAEAAADPVGRAQPPLTEEEVVAAIRAAKPEKDSAVFEELFRALKRIAETRVLPPKAEFATMTLWDPGEAFVYDVWWVRIEMPKEDGGGYSMPIRERRIRSRTLEEEIQRLEKVLQETPPEPGRYRLEDRLEELKKRAGRAKNPR